jgi:pimeloyl-ACP methyl ester carboxylesterase
MMPARLGSAGVESGAILLPGAVLPADLAYGTLVDALGEEVEAIPKELELYAGPAPPPDYTLRHEVDGVLRAADEAGFERFHLVGYSAGGASSVAFAASHPERLLSLALLEPAWMGNEGLSPEELVVRAEFDRITTLPPAELLPAFVASQLAPGVEPPPPPDAPPPPWMAKRPAGLSALITVFNASSLDFERLRAFDRPVLFVLGGRSNPDLYGRMAERAAAVFPDFTLSRFEQRHHFDPPHRAEPERTASELLDHWARAEG